MSSPPPKPAKRMMSSSSSLMQDANKGTAPQSQQQQQAPSAAEQLLASSCACPLESFVRVLPQKGTEPASSAATTSTAGMRRGILRYIGPTDFADGLWAGVELVGALGRNNGFGKSHEYFRCLPGQGVFVRPDLIQPYGQADGHATGSLATSPAAPAQRSSLAAEEEAAALALMEELETKLLAAERANEQLAAQLQAEKASREAAATRQQQNSAAAVAALEAQLHAAVAEREELTREHQARLSQETERRKQVEADLAALLSSAEDEDGVSDGADGLDELDVRDGEAASAARVRPGAAAAAAVAAAAAAGSEHAGAVEKLKGELDDMKAARQASDGLIESLKGHVQLLEQQCTEKGKELDAAKQALADAAAREEMRQHEQQAEHAARKAQLAAAEATTAALAEQVKRGDEARQACEQAAAERQQELLSIISKLESHQRSREENTLRASVAAADAAPLSIDSTEPTPHSVHDDAASLVAENAKLSLRVMEQEAALRQSADEASRLHAQHIQAVATWEERVAALANDVTTLTAQKAQWESALDEAKEGHASALEAHTQRSVEEPERERHERARQDEQHAARVTALEDELAATKEALALTSGVSATEANTLKQQLAAAQGLVSRQEDSITALAKERDDLREVCDLQEEELNAEKEQSDELSALLKSISDERAEEKALWAAEKETLEGRLGQHAEQIKAAQQEIQKWRRQCQMEQEKVKVLSLAPATHAVDGDAAVEDAAASRPMETSAALQLKVQQLTAELETAKLQVFQLEKTAEAFTQLQTQYASLSAEAEKAQRKAKKREQTLTQDYEEALEHVRGFKDKAQSECAQLRAEVQQLTHALAAATAATTSAPTGHAHGAHGGADGDATNNRRKGSRQGSNEGKTHAPSPSPSPPSPSPSHMSTREGSATEPLGGAGGGGGLTSGPGWVCPRSAQPPVFSSGTPLSDYEREGYEQTILSLQRQLLALRTRARPRDKLSEDAGASQLVDKLRDGVKRDQRELLDSATSHPAVHALDFATPAATEVSSRALFTSR